MIRNTALKVTLLSILASTGTDAQCGDNSPARPVPECVNSQGNEISCLESGAIRLWPDILRPGMPCQTLPGNRDTTDRIGGQTVPGAASGHEVFKGLDIVGSTLYVAYNAGIQAWSIAGIAAEDPVQLAFKDGWSGDFLFFPPVSEQLHFLESIAAANGTGGTDYLAVSGKAPGPGPTLWSFNGQSFRQLYQDLGTDARQVRLAEVGGRLYAFAAAQGRKGGLAVFDVTAAAALSTPCLDDRGSACPGVFLGALGPDAGYLDAIVVGGKAYVAIANGLNGRASIYALGSPVSAEAAVEVYDGVDIGVGSAGLAFFSHGGVRYLATVQWPGFGPKILKVFSVGHCLDADGCSSIGTPVMVRTLTEKLGGEDHLTFSRSGATPYLYYGSVTPTVEGPAVERLFDLRSFPGQIREITAGGGNYTDPCNGEQVDYWGRYHARNEHGLRGFTSRIGKFNGRYFYRASQTILDVHVAHTEP